jgi:heptosyltransferase I
MRILIVKLSSLGDIVHTMPAVQDLRHYLPDAKIDWVVEEGFGELAALCEGVDRVIALGLRRWRKQGLLSSQTRKEWRQFRDELRRHEYDYVFDFQGLVKSAWITRMAVLTPQGQRIGLANRTDGAGYEPLARLAYSKAIRVPPRIHAIERSRYMAAQSLVKPIYSSLSFGLAHIISQYSGDTLNSILRNNKLEHAYAVFVHGSSRADKLWREASWVKLAHELRVHGFRIALPWGAEPEREAAQRIAQGINQKNTDQAVVLPKLGLRELTAVIAQSALVVGVDSGLVHIASGLDVPTVQLYNFATSWRTGGYWNERTLNVERAGSPQDDEVIAAVNQVLKAAA